MIAALMQAFRSWSNAKAIAILASVAFAVGIGSTTAIYTVVHAVLLAPLPYADGDRFVALYGARFSEPKQFSSHTLPDLLEYRRRTTSFDAFGWFRLGEATLSAPGEPQHVAVVAVTPTLAHNLGAAPIAGRWSTRSRRRPASPTPATPTACRCPAAASRRRSIAKGIRWNRAPSSAPATRSPAPAISAR